VAEEYVTLCNLRHLSYYGNAVTWSVTGNMVDDGMALKKTMSLKMLT
jgi:hypothetical protein